MKLTNVFATGTLLGLLLAGSTSAETLTSTAKVQKPTHKQAHAAIISLGWCTNNLIRHENGHMSDSNFITAKDNYFKNKAKVENDPVLQNYVPQIEREKPSSMDKDARFKGLSYRQMFTLCDKAMMDVVNRIEKAPEPKNLAEAQIYREVNKADREAMFKEQLKGKKSGFEGVSFGIVDMLDELKNHTHTIEEFKKFLVKPHTYDHAWELTNNRDQFVTYEMWSGYNPLLIVVKKQENGSYIDGSKLPDAYYEVIGSDTFQVRYADGSLRDHEFVILEERKI